MAVHTERHPDLPPPVTSVGFIRWLRQNLFSSWTNTALTLLALYLLYLIIPPFLQWAFLDADWTGSRREDCTRSGACWVFIDVWFRRLMYGFYPADQQWRVNVGFAVAALLIVPLLLQRFPGQRWFAFGLFVLFPPVGYVLFHGGFGLPVVETSKWGGLTLTLVLAGIGIVAALPIGTLLALGRRATTMPVVQSLCIAFIEFWRGVPLITVLFMSSVMLPLFLPEDVSFDKLLRALIGITLFESAYMAEVVRGGLQAIPKGQYEAADALGFGYPKKMALIILPQALKLVIPGIVNTFIALFKDTTLVLIIGLLEVLGVIHSANADPDWLGFATEGYIFAALIFWIFCFGMSRYSQRLEKRLATGHKRR